MNIYASSSNRRIIIKSKSQICLILEYKNGVSAQFKQVPASISLVPLLNKPIFGCLGLINIDKECFVGVVSSVSSIGSLDSALVYNIQKVSFYSIQSSRFDSLTDSDPDTVHPCWLLKRILESGSFYFSPDVDLTRSTQKRTLDLQYGFLPNSLFNKTDSMFVWNANLLSPLLVIREQELDLQQQEETDRASFIGINEQRFGNTRGKFILISRLGSKRAGTRFNTRGIDDDGHVSNFVETEIIFQTSEFIYSFIQIRGSVPLFWEQPGFQVSQKLTIIRSETTLPSCRKHFNDLLNRYSKIHIVNLLKQNDPMSPECVLGDAYRSQVNQLKDLKSLIVFTGFDFHYAVKRDNYDKLKSLVDMVSYAFEENGYFLCDVSKNAIISTQTGIFRTNCLDCLDRTNVVQTLFAKYSIEQYFRAIGSSRIVDSEPFTSVFNSLWADNGDWLSMIYTGTGALKSSYTRKGKTTLAGFLDDAAKSATRLYVNNFQDKSRQEAIDLLLGKVPSSYVTLIRDPVFEYVLNELIVREAEYSTFRDINVLVTTFNVNGKTPMHSTEPLSNWLFSKTCPYPHLYVIGLQEMIELKVDQIVSADTEKQRSNWEQGLNKVLNSARTSTESLQYSYVILRSIKLVALGIFIFVRSDNIEMIRKMEVSIVMTGLGGMAGNKGGIGVSFNYNDTNLCFITAHLAAGSSNVEERNRDYKTISNGIKFSGKTIDDHDGIFWFGDFNYRISMDGDVVRSELAKGNMHSLTSCDQLNQEKFKEAAFMQLREGPLNFMPTYKYDNGTNTYDSSEKERTPSWTDRILFSGDCVEQLDYNRAELLMSDHRPVTSVFQIRVKKVDVNKKAALQQDIQKLVLSGNVNTDIVVHTKRISNRKPTTAMLIDISESSPISVTPEAPYNPFDDDFDVRFGGIQKPSTENDNWWDRPFDVEAIKFEGNSSNPFFVL